MLSTTRALVTGCGTQLSKFSIDPALEVLALDISDNDGSGRSISATLGYCGVSVKPFRFAPLKSLRIHLATLSTDERKKYAKAVVE
jgi:hypothetical protein